MKAAIFHDPYALEVRTDVADPRAGPGEVLLQVAACGICGSDMHLYRTNAHRNGGGVLRVDPDGREIPGHEYAGTIVAVGEGVEGYSVGDRVVGVTGGGAFADYVPVPVNPFQIAPIPDGLSFEEAATTEPMADSLQIVRKGEVRPGENVAVFGVGIIGLGVIQVLRALGVGTGKIVAIDVSDARLALAKEIGATDTINPRDADPVARAIEICGPASTTFSRATGADIAVVFDCAGYLKHMKGPPPLQTALDMLRPDDGRIVCFGAYEGPVTLNLDPLIGKQPRIVGSLGYASAELTQAIDLMASGKVDRAKLISHRFPLDRITEAFETQGNGSAIKVMVLPGEAL